MWMFCLYLCHWMEELMGQPGCNLPGLHSSQGEEKRVCGGGGVFLLPRDRGPLMWSSLTWVLTGCNFLKVGDIFMLQEENEALNVLDVLRWCDTSCANVPQAAAKWHKLRLCETSCSYVKQVAMMWNKLQLSNANCIYHFFKIHIVTCWWVKVSLIWNIHNYNINTFRDYNEEWEFEGYYNKRFG